MLLIHRGGEGGRRGGPKGVIKAPQTRRQEFNVRTNHGTALLYRLWITHRDRGSFRVYADAEGVTEHFLRMDGH